MELTAKEFINKLESLRTEKGIRMGSIFKLAKEYMLMPLPEVEKLLDRKEHEARVGAVSIMDFQARDKKISKEQKKEVFDLYIKKHDRINTWDLVDRSAIYVVGSYLFDKPKDILYKLAKSKMMAERRTAAVATFFFIKNKQVEDSIKIAEILVHDPDVYIHKAVGWVLRTVGGKELLEFLDKHAATMPREMLRYSIEKLTRDQKKHYLNLKMSKI